MLMINLLALTLCQGPCYPNCWSGDGVDSAVCELYGTFRLVSGGADYRVKFVSNGEHLRVRYTDFPSQAGEWKRVSFGPQFTVQEVQSGEDFRVRIVRYSPPGCWGS